MTSTKAEQADAQESTVSADASFADLSNIDVDQIQPIDVESSDRPQ